jgi:hypothetical protein
MKYVLWAILIIAVVFDTGEAIRFYKARTTINSPLRTVTHIFAGLDIANNFTALQQLSGGVSSDGSHTESIPARTQTLLDTISAGACGANNWINAVNSAAGPGCAQPSAGNLSNGTTGSGAVVLAANPTISSATLTQPQINGGITNGTGVEHLRFTGCTVVGSCTGSASWSTSFADTNYTFTCTAHTVGDSGSNYPLVVGTYGKTAGGFGYILQSPNGVTYVAGETMECVAVHD